MNDKLYVFGTCSGTEPHPGRHHVSFAIRHNEKLYWFDAGECCSYTAHMMGVDVRDIRAIFISHPHMDHIGGLGNLFWNIRKLDSRGENKCAGKTIDLFMPDEKTWPALYELLQQTEGGFNHKFDIRVTRENDGVIFEDGDFRVSALHNTHLPQLEDGTYRSYSYLIETGTRKIVFSGDTGNYTELKPLLSEADMLLAETGHHRPAAVCAQLNEMGLQPEVMFIHHGRPLLDTREETEKEARDAYAGKIRILDDADVIDL